MKWAAMMTMLLILTTPTSVLAHGEGQQAPSIFLNGVGTQPNPYYSPFAAYGNKERMATSDYAPEQYKVGQSIHFEYRPTTDDMFPGAEYRWVWGQDETSSVAGLTAQRAFSSSGSHIVSLQVKIAAGGEFQDFETVKVDVAPQLPYKAPSAKIKLIKTVEREGSYFAILEALPLPGSTGIKDFYWDFGNTSGEKGKAASFPYSPPRTGVGVWSDEFIRRQPTLRVTDENGIYSDIPYSVTMDEEAKRLELFVLGDNETKSTPWWLGLLAGVGAIGLIALIFALHKKVTSTGEAK